MVNKAALGVLGVIVLVSMGVGVLIGMQLGGGPTGGNNVTANDGGGVTPIPVETGSTPSPIPTAGMTTAQSTAQSTAETTRSTPARTTVPSRRFDASEIADIVKRLVNEERRSRGLDPLTTSGQTVARIDRMALGHSVHMADAGRLTHNIDGNSSLDRYRRANLYDSCQFANEVESFLITAEGNNLEVITRTVAGRWYTDDGQPQFNENETEVARAIVRNWFDSQVSRSRLLYENAERIGVGVEVTQDGTVYATANLC